MAGEAQAMLLNFENLLVAQFGEDAALGDRLAVPLQLSGFRNDGSLRSLRKAQAQLPADVSNFLAGHRIGVDDDVLTSPEYCLRPEFGGCFAFYLVRGGLVVACFHYMGGVGGWWWG